MTEPCTEQNPCRACADGLRMEARRSSDDEGPRNKLRRARPRIVGRALHVDLTCSQSLLPQAWCWGCVVGTHKAELVYSPRRAA